MSNRGCSWIWSRVTPQNNSPEPVFESFVVETRYHTLLPTQILSDVVSSEFQLGMALICIEGGGEGKGKDTPAQNGTMHQRCFTAAWYYYISPVIKCSSRALLSIFLGKLSGVGVAMTHAACSRLCSMQAPECTTKSQTKSVYRSPWVGHGISFT
jgi:hypothetical protein